MIPEPFAGGSVIRKNGFDNSVECFGMVHLFSVSQLMDDYIVQNSLRGEDKSPVEVQVAGAAAAPPSGLLFPDGDPAVSHAYDTGVVCRLLREYGPGGLHVMFPFLFRQRRAGWGRMRPGFFEMFYHPVLFTAYKRIDEGTGAAVWSPDPDFSVTSDLDRDGLAAAVYDLI